MGVITITEEYTSPIPPARLFKALFLDADNFLPKLLPQVLKSIELVQGDGGAGSVKQMNFAEGIDLGALKHRIDEINEETFVYNYTLIEGEDLVGKLEKVSHETKFEPSPDGGSISKITSKYYTLDDAAITEDEIKASKEKAMGMYKAVEGYLLQNPDAYA